MNLELNGDFIILRGTFDTRDRDIISEIPERRRYLVDGSVVLPATPRNLRHLSARALAVPGIEVVQSRLAEIERELNPQPLPPEASFFGFKTQPYEHQRQAFDWARNRQHYALFMEMGTGKTKVALDVAADRWARGEINRLLIVAPNGVQRQWINEQIPTHLPEWVEHDRWTFQAGKEWPEAIANPNGVRLAILAVNVESFAVANRLSTLAGWIRGGKTMVVVDESTRIKNPKAKRTKNLIACALSAVSRVILTGAPVTRHVVDLYSQFQFLNPAMLGFQSFVAFRSHYCELQPAYRGAPIGAVKIVGTRNLDELTERIERFAFRVTKSEALDLPPKQYLTREVELTPEQRRVYREMREQFRVWLRSGEHVTAANTAVRLMRLQQIVCGYLPAENGTVQALPHNRINELLEVLNELPDEKVVVWARFQHDIDRIAAALSEANVTFTTYDGRTSLADRTSAIEGWTSGAFRVFVGNPQAAGIGINGLQSASYVVYYSNSFNAEHRWQSEDRTHRIGTNRTVTYIDFVAPNTIDRKLLAALVEKKNIAELIVERGDLDDNE